MKNRLKLIIASVMAIMVGAVGMISPAALATTDSDCDPMTGGVTGGAECAQKDTNVPSDIFGGSDSIFSKVVKILLFLVGSVSVVMIIVGGVRYATSAGNEKAVTGAKNTILYAVIGLIVAILGYAIVNLVTGWLMDTGS